MRRSMKTKILLAALVLMAAACKQKSPGEPNMRVTKPMTRGATMFVTVKDGLNLRAEPSETGKRLALIPYSEQVQKIEDWGELIKIDQTEGKWTKVAWRVHTGWVFGGFLSDLPPGVGAAHGGQEFELEALKNHFETLWFLGPGAGKERGTLEIRGQDFQCGGTKVSNVEITRNGVTYDLQDVNCTGGQSRGDCGSCRTENLRSCTVSADLILGASRGDKLEAGKCS